MIIAICIDCIDMHSIEYIIVYAGCIDCIDIHSIFAHNFLNIQWIFNLIEVLDTVNTVEKP